MPRPCGRPHLAIHLPCGLPPSALGPRPRMLQADAPPFRLAEAAERNGCALVFITAGSDHARKMTPLLAIWAPSWTRRSWTRRRRGAGQTLRAERHRHLQRGAHRSDCPAGPAPGPAVPLRPGHRRHTSKNIRRERLRDRGVESGRSREMARVAYVGDAPRPCRAARDHQTHHRRRQQPHPLGRHRVAVHRARRRDPGRRPGHRPIGTRDRHRRESSCRPPRRGAPGRLSHRRLPHGRRRRPPRLRHRQVRAGRALP